ncbi:MAG TPA: nucleotidyltransferase family protein [Candidatus Hydrogenedentes bacterium]|nr:nucleotidyltransferase family protein [Candidatus Hydrogenedentota bacterium]HIJ73866.1 nucleotidyltransferase family protein [Candidatus Hydrogenedentota bacterium]
MKRDEAARILREHRAELHAMAVASLAIFGSTARDEAHDRSDVDLLIEFDRPVGLFHFFRVQRALERMLGVSRVDLVQRGAVHPALKERIYKEAIRVA